MSSQPAHYFFQWYKIIAHIFPYKLRSISYLSILLHYSTVCWFYYLNIMLTEKVQFSPLGNTGVHRFVEGTAGLQSPDKLKAFLQTPGEGRQREWDSAESSGQEMNLAPAMWASEERMGHWEGQKHSECWFPWEGDCQAEAAGCRVSMSSGHMAGAAPTGCLLTHSTDLTHCSWKLQESASLQHCLSRVLYWKRV